MSSIAAIASQEEVLKSIFMTDSLSEFKVRQDGIYKVKLYIRGIPQIITVDDIYVFKKTDKGVFNFYFAQVG